MDSIFDTLSSIVHLDNHWDDLSFTNLFSSDSKFKVCWCVIPILIKEYQQIPT